MAYDGYFYPKKKHKDFVVHQPLTFVPQEYKRTFLGFFRPLTMQKYINRYANKEVDTFSNIYALDGVTATRKVKDLYPPIERIPLFYIALSHSKEIIFDLNGLGPLSVEQVLTIIKDNVRQGGTSVLFETMNVFADQCDEVIRIDTNE